MTNRTRTLSVSMALLAGLALAACDKKESPSPEPTTKTTPAQTASATPDTPKPAAGALAEVKGNYKVDPVHSAVVFSAKHAGLSWTYGMINKVTGKMKVDEDASKSTVELEFDMNSVFTADKKRDDHLKSPDFFNTKQFPTATFKSKEIKSSSGEKFDVTGDLTLHGVTKPVTITMEHVGHGEFSMDKSYRAGFEGQVTIKRSDFDIKTMPDAVSDEVRLTISVEGIRE